MDILKRVNRTKVTPALLGEVMEMHASLPPEDRQSFETRAVRVFELLDKKGAGKRLADLATAIDFRLTALAGLLASKEVRGWTISGAEPGQEHIHADLVQTAAAEPVIEGADGRASFDIESFRARLLRITKPKGQA